MPGKGKKLGWLLILSLGSSGMAACWYRLQLLPEPGPGLMGAPTTPAPATARAAALQVLHSMYIDLTYLRKLCLC